MTKQQAWIEESKRKNQEVVVIIKNKDTGEETETSMNPEFAVYTAHGEIS